MSFEHEHTVTTSASPSDVWRLWSDIATWPTWDPQVERVVLDGPFRVGTTGTMVLGGGIEMPFELLEVQLDARYVDVLRMGELEIRIDHLVRAVEGGAEVTVRTSIEGPGADDIGPMVTADAPVAMAALTAMAEAGAPVS